MEQSTAPHLQLFSQAALELQRCAAHLHEQVAMACWHSFSRAAPAKGDLKMQRPCKWQLLQQTKFAGLSHGW